jgi:hypothetical protein
MRTNIIGIPTVGIFRWPQGVSFVMFAGQDNVSNKNINWVKCL